jgi:threonine dehydratase
VLFKCLVVDRPGALAPLLNEVAALKANVIDVYHRRAVWLAPLGKVGIELVLEVRDNAHADAVQEHLDTHGYSVVRDAPGEWPV